MLNQNSTIQCSVYLADLLQFGDDLTPFQFKLMAKALNWEWVNGRTPDRQRFMALCGGPRNHHERAQLDELVDFYESHVLTVRMRKQREGKLAAKHNYSEAQKRRWNSQDQAGNGLGNGLGNGQPNGQVSTLKSNQISKATDKSDSELSPSSSSTSSSTSRDTKSPNGDLAGRPSSRKKSGKLKAEESENPELLAARVRYHAIFAEAFTATYGGKYVRTVEGSAQLARLQKAQADALTDETWTTAVRNYFATLQSSHSMQDLAARFLTFKRSSLDRFGKPTEADNGRTNGIERTQRVAGSVVDESGNVGWAAREF